MFKSKTKSFILSHPNKSIFPRNVINSNLFHSNFDVSRQFSGSNPCPKSAERNLKRRKLLKSSSSVCPSNEIMDSSRTKIEEKIGGVYDAQRECYHTLYMQEKEEKIRYFNIIKSLESKINDLERELAEKSTKCYCKLISENEQLSNFKSKVYAFSQKYDELNVNFLALIKSVDTTFQNLSLNKQLKKFDFFMEEMGKTYNNFKDLFNTLAKFMTNKQEEYNFLLKTKDDDITQLKFEICEIKKKCGCVCWRHCLECEEINQDNNEVNNSLSKTQFNDLINEYAAKSSHNSLNPNISKSKEKNNPLSTVRQRNSYYNTGYNKNANSLVLNRSRKDCQKARINNLRNRIFYMLDN